MSFPTQKPVVRSAFAVIAATLFLNLAPASLAEVVRKPLLNVPRLTANLIEVGVQIRTDGAGGVVAIYDIYDNGGSNGGYALKRRLIWLNDMGQTLASLEVGLGAEIAAAFKNRCYLMGEVKVTGEQAVRVVNRDGKTEVTSGAGELGVSELGNVYSFTSEPFAQEGFFAFEYYLPPTAPPTTIPRLQIVRYVVK